MLTKEEIYSEAKRALNASAPDRVVCRSKESIEIENLIRNCFEQKRAISLYVNGQPGTGKTLLVTHILDTLKENYKFKRVFLNCMSIKNIQSLYKIMTQEMSGVDAPAPLTPSKRTNKDSLAKSVDAMISSLKHHIVLVLDEIDQIETNIKSSTDLYKIFDWPYLPNSKLILIGIANALDFTDRLLPRLELKPEFKPKIVKFMPYSKDDITNIVKDRLKAVQLANNNSPIIDDKALMLCASKIASTSGDIRKALDICRRAIEYVEQENKFNNTNTASNVTGDAADKFKPVGIAQMMRTFNQVNPMTNSNLDKETMPLLQKILLCTVLLCTKDAKLKEIGFSKLYDKFNKICKSYSTGIDSESEFINLCTLLQDNGLIDLNKKSKEIRNYKVSLKLDEQELRDRLQDETFMSDILNNISYK